MPEDSTRYLAFYGTLMAAVGGLERFGVARRLRFVSPCRIFGRLYDIGSYPGLVVDSGEMPAARREVSTAPSEVAAELYEMQDNECLHVLDAYEGYDPDDPAGSLYLRRCLRLSVPDVDAWVYVFNRDCSQKPVIASGSWQQYQAERRFRRGPKAQSQNRNV